MKRALIFAAALSLLMPAAAMAAPNKDKDHHSGTTKPDHGGKPAKPGKPGGGHHHKPGKPGKPDVKPPHRPGHGNNRPGHKPGWNHGKPGKPGWNRPGRPGGGYHKPRPSQYYWRGKWYGRTRVSAFLYPRGYHYRIWYEGNVLPSLFLTSSYFYDGYAALGLEAPPPGYRWVRYGPDLLLVDLHTGSVEQVVYGAFY